MLTVVKDGQAVVVANKINDNVSVSDTFTWSINKIKEYVDGKLGTGTGGTGGLDDDAVNALIAAALADYETALTAEGKYVSNDTLTLFKTLILNEIGIDATGEIVGTEPAFAAANKDTSTWVAIEKIEKAFDSLNTGMDTNIVDVTPASITETDIAATIKAVFGSVGDGKLFYVKTTEGTEEKLSIWKKIDDNAEPTKVIELNFNTSAFATKAYVDGKTNFDGITITGTGASTNPFKVAEPVKILYKAQFDAIEAVLVNGDTTKDALYAIIDA
jgi:hypothetical protein